MKIRPYLTYQGTCLEAIKLYEKAFNIQATEITSYSDISANPENPVPEGFKDQVVQAILPIGDDFIRLSDCPQELNAPESERISIAVEAPIAEINRAFSVLAEEGRVAIPLAETFYSPLAGVVFDKYGVMWNMIAQSD